MTSPHRVGGALRVPVLGGDRRLRLGNDHGEAVRDDVVQVAADPGALVGGGEREALALLPLGVVGTLLQRSQVGLTAAGTLAERVGEGEGEQPGHARLDHLVQDALEPAARPAGTGRNVRGGAGRRARVAEGDGVEEAEGDLGGHEDQQHRRGQPP